MSGIKTVEIVADKEVIIRHRNDFQKSLLDNILDLKRYQIVKEINPEYHKPRNPQLADSEPNRKYVDEMIDDCRKSAANAKSYVEICDELLKADEAGTLAEAWAEIDNVQSPIQDVDEKGKDESEETKA